MLQFTLNAPRFGIRQHRQALIDGAFEQPPGVRLDGLLGSRGGKKAIHDQGGHHSQQARAGQQNDELAYGFEMHGRSR